VPVEAGSRWVGAAGISGQRDVERRHGADCMTASTRAVPDRRSATESDSQRRPGVIRPANAEFSGGIPHGGSGLLCAVVVGSGLLVATLEDSDPERNIRTIPDGLWWAITTITTVGYGDRFPVTAAGRAIGAGVMVLGIALSAFLPPRWLHSSSRGTSRKNSIRRWPRSTSDSSGSSNCYRTSSRAKG
jgi:hypothetical protein